MTASGRGPRRAPGSAAAAALSAGVTGPPRADGGVMSVGPGQALGDHASRIRRDQGPDGPNHDNDRDNAKLCFHHYIEQIGSSYAPSDGCGARDCPIPPFKE
ncbi:hypothetical protein GCM10028833_10620 [Glycomyces tarimensis]